LPDLTVKLSSLKLENPTMLAAGVLGISASLLRKVAEAGAGAIVTKSIGLEPRNGYPNPTVASFDFGLLNAMGLSNPGIKVFSKDITILKRLSVPVIVSIFASNKKDFAKLAVETEKVGADALELNVSCPNIKGVSQICQDTNVLSEVIESVKASVKIPIFTKISPNITDIVQVAKAAEDAGSDAVTAINTVRAMAIDTETGRPVLSNKIGGLSGPAIRPIAVRCVYEISKVLKIPVIGCGGVSSWKDALELILAGATAVQIGTAIKNRKLDIFREVVTGLKSYLEKKEYAGVKEIIGLSHKY
jgi:dihydroorotate dehydrogenase (NAD+) catalytic subunit